MKKPYSIPVFIVTAFGAGTLSGFEFQIPLLHLLFSGLFLFLIFIFTYLKAKKHFFQKPLFGIITFGLLFFLGFFNSQIHQPSNRPTHYLHHNLEDSVFVTAKLNQKLRTTSYSENYIAEIKQINRQSASGKIRISFPRDSATLNSLYDFSEIAFTGKLQQIKPPLNPYQFDYAAYMADRRVYKQISLSFEDIVVLNRSKTSIRAKASFIRNELRNLLLEQEFPEKQIPLVEALLLGQRTDFPPEVYAKFADAGVVHVLAVSGLHVGIILMLLQFILKPLSYLPSGKLLRSVIIILFLWFFAFLAGLSPSVLRAVTMFSFLSLGLAFKRKVFSINMLCLSAFVLLLYEPGYLKDVGFQLSYSAVLSILLFQQKIYKLLPLNHLLVRYFWGISSVTLSAQLGVLPLSLYYFHQFPGLFFISNLLIIPFLGIILALGIFTLVLLGIFHQVPDFLLYIFSKSLDFLQFIVDLIAAREGFLLRNIYFSQSMLLISLLIIALAAFSIHKKKVFYLLTCLAMIIGLQVIYLIEIQQKRQEQNFYIFHRNTETLLGFQTGANFQFSAADKNIDLSFLSGLQNNYGGQSWSVSDSLYRYYDLNDNGLFIIDHEIYSLPETSAPSYILLSNSPEINLEKLFSNYHPSMVIADGSNYTSRVQLWEKTCREHKVPFHYTGEKGAFIYPLK